MKYDRKYYPTVKKIKEKSGIVILTSDKMVIKLHNILKKNVSQWTFSIKEEHIKP